MKPGLNRLAWRLPVTPHHGLPSRCPGSGRRSARAQAPGRQGVGGLGGREGYFQVLCAGLVLTETGADQGLGLVCCPPRTALGSQQVPVLRGSPPLWEGSPVILFVVVFHVLSWTSSFPSHALCPLFLILL